MNTTTGTFTATALDFFYWCSSRGKMCKYCNGLGQCTKLVCQDTFEPIDYVERKNSITSDHRIDLSKDVVVHTTGTAPNQCTATRRFNYVNPIPMLVREPVCSHVSISFNFEEYVTLKEAQAGLTTLILQSIEENGGLIPEDWISMDDVRHSVDARQYRKWHSSGK